MKYFVIFLIILTGCNPPRMRRLGYDDNNRIIDGGDSPIIIGDGGGGTPSTPGTGTTPGVPSHCSFASASSLTYKHSSSFFGKFNMCRSAGSSTETIYLQLASAFYSSAKLCLIPVAKFKSGYIEIGEARCLSSSDPLKIHEIPIYISRYGYDFAGIMVMKDQYYQYEYPYGNIYSGASMLAPDAFLLCSNALRINTNYAYCNAFYKNPHHLVLLQ